MNKSYFAALLLTCVLTTTSLFSQNYTFNFTSNGRRVCLVESEVDLSTPLVTIKLLDHSSNNTYTTNIYRRSLYGTGADWQPVASDLPAGTPEWTDTDVVLGDVWEYQLRRQGSWTYNSITYDAIGYTIGALLKNNTNYQGQMILLVANDVADSLPSRYLRLKKELTGEGWFVNEIIVPKASNWDSGDTVVAIRNQIINLYNSTPPNDKPKALFILGHVPMPRSGSSTVTAPDGHDQNKGARGFDGFYADIDGIYTDDSTYNPGGLQTPYAINLPGDYKWDQDFFNTDIEMAFGRVDFFDVTDYPLSEMNMFEIYLDKLSNYRNVTNGFEMGEKTAFSNGYNNSNDGSFRSLPSISKSENIYENTSGGIHPEWVANNGPFKIYMQNQSAPQIGEWNTFGMNATVYSSDQSYWGYNDCPQNGSYSRIRSLIASDTKCIVALWTTTTINTFYQSCTGDPLAFAIREKMNHNTSNNNIETPESEWDTQEWWNRTHLTYIGDPTIRLFQVKPPSDFNISNINELATLTWVASPDEDIVGYNIYKSNTEYGVYNRINSSLISELEYVDINYALNDWYMVRAIKKCESGCGQFLQASIGIFKKGDIILSQNELAFTNEITISPNPATKNITIGCEKNITSLQMMAFDGKIKLKATDINATKIDIDVSKENPGIYYLIIQTNNTTTKRKIIVL